MSGPTQESARYRWVFADGAFTLFGPAFHRGLANPIVPYRLPYNPGAGRNPPRFGLVRVRSPLLAESRLISLPAGTEMFHFPAFPHITYGFSHVYWGMSPSGLPHSEIPGSKPACGSPRLIAACHVLHRLPAPRHPPCALSSLTLSSGYSVQS